MTKVTHTPGPWIYQYSPYTSQDGREIPAFEVHGDDVKVCDTNEDRPVTEQEANACLIAAAPDLLEAAEKVIASWERGDLAGAVRQLDAAIELAKGGAG
jgi:hypothetical protein